jgi:hypothetical protein
MHKKYQERWDSEEGRLLQATILQMIRKGAGEDFLQAEFQNGKLGLLEDEWDLRGFSMHSEDIDFPVGDTFEAIDFSFGRFSNCHLKNALFNCSMTMTTFHTCTFSRCVFIYNNCYAALFEKCRFVECDFVDQDSFTNCLFLETSFRNTFFHGNVFQDCSFDASTSIDGFPSKPHSSWSAQLSIKQRSAVLRAIGEAYQAGQALLLSRRYAFESFQASTRYNSVGMSQKALGFFLEYVCGYGLRPSRVILSTLVYFFLTFLLFGSQVGFGESLIFSAGAIFTFGAKAGLIDQLNWFSQVWYVLSSFVGISLSALFVTVMFNVFIARK